MSERKLMILEAAARILHHQGTQKTTVAAIAREACVGVGTVYLEFSNKGAILRELAHSKFELVLRRMRREAMGQGAYEERLCQMMVARTKAFFELAASGAHGADLIHQPCPEALDARRAFERAQHELIADFLDQAHDLGVLHAPAPGRLASAWLHAHHAFNPPWVLSVPEEAVLERLTALHGLLLHGLRPGQAYAPEEA